MAGRGAGNGRRAGAVSHGSSVRFEEGPMGHDDRVQLMPEGLPQAPDRAPATRVRYQVLAAGCTLALLTYIQRLGFERAVPDIKQGLGLNDQQMGYVASAFLVAY